MTYLVLYYFLFAVIIVIEHAMFYRRWRRREWARWAMGIITVFLWAGPLALTGYLDLKTLLVVFIAFGIGGAIKGGMDIDQEISEAQSVRTEITKESHW